jgi:hypothetical protein
LPPQLFWWGWGLANEKGDKWDFGLEFGLCIWIRMYNMYDGEA